MPWTRWRRSDADLAQDIVERDADVDRLYWMAVKQYNLILKDRKLSEKIGVDIFEGMNLMIIARVWSASATMPRRSPRT